MLDENEMSRRLVEFCNENKTFKKILSLCLRIGPARRI